MWFTGTVPCCLMLLTYTATSPTVCVAGQLGAAHGLYCYGGRLPRHDGSGTCAYTALHIQLLALNAIQRGIGEQLLARTGSRTHRHPCMGSRTHRHPCTGSRTHRHPCTVSRTHTPTLVCWRVCYPPTPPPPLPSGIRRCCHDCDVHHHHSRGHCSCGGVRCQSDPCCSVCSLFQCVAFAALSRC